MEFEYEISADDYAAAALLHHRLGRKRMQAAGWFFAGASLLAVGLIEQDRGLSPILLAAIGVWFAWVGISWAFPGEGYRRRCRKQYRKLGFEGHKYRATASAEGFEVVGENRTWRNSWSHVSPKGEDERVFMFHSAGVVFVFAKRYLADEQQRELRTLAGLTPDA